jgi:hypothetical protein
MQSATGSVAADGIFPVDVLMKSVARGHRQQRRATHVVVRAELAGLEDHLEVRLPDGLLHLDDLVVDLRVPAGEEGAAVDDHVDLVGAELDRAARVATLRSVGYWPDGKPLRRRRRARRCRGGARRRSARGSR